MNRAADIAKARRDDLDGVPTIATPVASDGVVPVSEAGAGRPSKVAGQRRRPGERRPLVRGGYSMEALRTLVVEDDAVIGELLAETLEGLGHRVCAVENNIGDAVTAARRHRPDLMIVDVGLGEESGVAAVKEILRSHFAAHVFVTGIR
jgi:PleD family two-component response regulator